MLTRTPPPGARQHRYGPAVAITVAALGYFVDIYDLTLFGMVRKASLADLGYGEAQQRDLGLLLMQIQMLGLLVGGIVWGILGDKRGRLSVLFGSILMYSVANLANGFGQGFADYAVLRFIAGVGLAGELGAGVTLVAEMMPTRLRGYGPTIIASFGLLGALAAGEVARMDWGLGVANWRVAYFIGGGLGLGLLLLRVGVFESTLFEKTKQDGITRGDFLALFRRRDLLVRYLKCILLGVPVWFTVGVLVFFADAFAVVLGVQDAASLEVPVAIMYCYAGLAVGDMASGLLSQFLRSRKRAILVFLGISALAMAWFLWMDGVSVQHVYWVCFAIGFGAGYWAVMMINASEQFGTNIRATVTTTVPNFVRGSLTLTAGVFGWLTGAFDSPITAAWVVGLPLLLAAVWAAATLPETFYRDLDYLEV
jgi:predicted MFS family arabinose efflux permease